MTKKLIPCKNVNKQECDIRLRRAGSARERRSETESSSISNKSLDKTAERGSFSQCIRKPRIRRCLRESANLLSQFI